ncbi:MAG: BREX-3 system P-loop-containing protein BrxF [Burkholderiaceae bacterium]|nr:BREX-3 system P-loop-containing protein BrxF [Burkholderiaceae bacterium]
MLEKLEKITDEAAALHSKLIVLIGERGAGKSKLLSALGKRHEAHILNVGSELGRRLSACPVKLRPLLATDLLRELANGRAASDLLLIDNIELLFDRTLQLDPLDLLKQLARSRRVVAVWPGQLRDGRLVYAQMGHPEHQDYGLDGLVPFAIQ